MSGERVIGQIWAEAHDHVIGAQGGMPWRVPEDTRHFVEVTTGTTVIMGRGSWEALPQKFRPLPDRRNLVVSRTLSEAEGAEVFSSLDAALAAAEGEVWIVGGGQLYRTAMSVSNVLEITYLDLDVEGDTTAPEVDASWHEVTATEWRESTSGIRYRFVRYER